MTRHPRRPSPGNRAARLARTPDPVALLSSRRSFFLIVFLRSASPDPTQDRSRTTSREATQHQVSRGDPHSSAGKIFCLQAHCVFLGRNKISVRSVSDSDCRIAAQHVRVRRCLPLGDDKDSLVSFPLAPPIGDRGARARVRLVASNARRRPRSSRAVAGAREHGGRGRASRVLRTARLRSSWFSNLGTPTSTLALTDSPAFPPPSFLSLTRRTRTTSMRTRTSRRTITGTMISRRTTSRRRRTAPPRRHPPRSLGTRRSCSARCARRTSARCASPPPPARRRERARTRPAAGPVRSPRTPRPPSSPSRREPPRASSAASRRGPSLRAAASLRGGNR